MTSIDKKPYNTNPQGNESNLAQTAVGIVAGGGCAYAFRKGVGYVKTPYMKYFTDRISNFTEEEKDILVSEANKMVEESGIRSNGFKDIDLISMDKIDTTGKKFKIDKSQLKGKALKGIKQELLETLENQTRVNPDAKGRISLREAMRKTIAESAISLIKGSLALKLQVISIIISSPLKKIADLMTGVIPTKKAAKQKVISAFTFGAYNPISNGIFTSKPASLLHEVGHAINKNSKSIAKLPAPISVICMTMLIPLVTLNGVFTKKPSESDNDEHKGLTKKLSDFVHKHVGFTVTGLFIPTLIEEGLASIRAVKFANKSEAMTEIMKKNHNKNLAIAYSSYLIGAAVISLSTKFAISVKDKIAGMHFKKGE